jgi:hypothetical protein
LQVVKPIHELLPYGYSADNPVKFPESHVLEDAIKKELQRLETTKQKFTVPQLIAHLKEVGEKAFTPSVVSQCPINPRNPKWFHYTHVCCDGNVSTGLIIAS